MKKLVLTGAAGRLGSYLREPLSKMCDELVSTDLVDDIGNLYPGETYAKGDLASLDDMMRILQGADMVIHMGAFVDEGRVVPLAGCSSMLPQLLVIGSLKTIVNFVFALFVKERPPRYASTAPSRVRTSICPDA